MKYDEKQRRNKLKRRIWRAAAGLMVLSCTAWLTWPEGLCASYSWHSNTGTIDSNVIEIGVVGGEYYIYAVTTRFVYYQNGSSQVDIGHDASYYWRGYKGDLITSAEPLPSDGVAGFAIHKEINSAQSRFGSFMVSVRPTPSPELIFRARRLHVG